MKVLHLVSAATLTGPADPALGLAKGQRRRGIDAQIAFDRVRSGNMPQKVAEAGVPEVEGLSLCTKGGLIMALKDRRRIRELAESFDLIHVHTSHDHALAIMARGSALLVRSIHHPRSAARRGLQGVAYRRTDGFLLTAEAHRELLLESYPLIPKEKTLIVPGAVDHERFNPKIDGSAIREDHGIPEDAFVLGMIARIKPGRRHRLMLAAFAAASRRHPHLWLALIGKGEGVQLVEEEIATRSLGQVAMYGFRDADLVEAIRSCDATVLLAEGNDAGCRAVLESLASGVPVIGARFPAVEEAIEGGDCGILIPPGDLDALTRAILDLASLASEKRSVMAKNARERILARHTDEHRSTKVMELYDQLMKREEG